MLLSKILERSKSIIPSWLWEYCEKIDQSPAGRRMAKGIFWSFFGTVLPQVLLLITGILSARILGKSVFGEFGMIRSTANMFSVFAGFGLGVTATKYISEYRETHKEKTGKIIGLIMIFSVLAGIVVALLVFFLSPYLSTNSINAPNLVTEIRLISMMLLFTSISSSQIGILAGFESFKKIAKVNLLSAVIMFPLQITLIIYFGLTGSAISMGINAVIMSILGYFTVRKVALQHGIKIVYFHNRDQWKVLTGFSLPALLSGLLVTPVIWKCNSMLVKLPSGYDEMAVFDAANQWRNAILLIPSILSQIVLPMLSGFSNNKGQFNKILFFNLKLNALTSFVLAIIISLFSSLIMKPYGEGFNEGYVVLIILAFTNVLVAVNNVIGQAIAASGNMWIGFVFNLAWGIYLIFLSRYFFQSGYGAIGLSLSLLISYFMHSIAQLLYVKLKL
jgi:O-antigen/teichoic acid export membrane protein